ncbi:hypothetical protein ACQPWY_27770 [Pseudonocardia xinjiangensis]|uniref:hypothetical protein n=1 Tax=Pseudonocardia xinjiangensis TaxID=75289 RepID=UPI003D944C78
MIAESIDELDREVSVDSSIVRAHQHASGARTAGRAAQGGERILARARRSARCDAQ